MSANIGRKIGNLCRNFGEKQLNAKPRKVANDSDKVLRDLDPLQEAISEKALKEILKVHWTYLFREEYLRSYFELLKKVKTLWKLLNQVRETKIMFDLKYEIQILT